VIIDLFTQLLLTLSFVESSSLSCTHNGNSYSVGTANIRRSRCDRCHCLPNTLYASAAGLVCQTTQCPPLNCPSVLPPADGECCPRCRVCDGVQITNCPSGVVRVSLPASQDEVLYSFSADARDCTDKRRRVTITKSPQGNIYKWNGATGHDVTVTASVTGPDASDPCKFKIIPVGKSFFYVISTNFGYLTFRICCIFEYVVSA